MTAHTDEQQVVLQRLGAVTLAAAPKTWTAFVLHVDVQRTGSTTSIPTSMRSEQPGIGLVTDEVHAAVRELVLLFDRQGHPIAGLDGRFARRADGQWGFATDFRYL